MENLHTEMKNVQTEVKNLNSTNIVKIEILEDNQDQEKNKIYKKKRTDIYCGNCGKYGHTYKKCTDPVTSLGIILFTIDKNDNISFLLIQRKDTLGYVEFLRGRYKLDQINFIKKLLFEITEHEINKLKEKDFDYLWENLWMKQNNKSNKNYKNEYENSKQKFNELKNGYFVNGEFFNLSKILNSIETNWKEPEWGFPKGRRNLRESDINCAAREFKEETGYQDSDFIILKNIKPVIEDFVGTNNIRYRHIYFIGRCITEKIPIINKHDKLQTSEVSNIGWFSLNNATSKLRPYNLEKKKVLKKVNDILINNNLFQRSCFNINDYDFYM